MSEQSEPPTNYPEPTNYPAMPAYNQPTAPLPPTGDEHDKGMAVTALALALGGLVVLLIGIPFTPFRLAAPLLGFFAAVLGAIAANRAGRDEAGGRTIAVAGLWIGIADVVLGFLLILLLVVSS